LKTLHLLDSATAAVLGFEWLKTALTPVSPYGDRHFERLRPFAPGDEPAAQSRANAIAAIAVELDAARLEAIRAAMRNLPDAQGAIARASMGDVLDDPNFFELLRFCTTIERIDELLVGCTGCVPISNHAVRAVKAALALGSAGEAGFYLADAFDRDLASARECVAREQAELDALRGRESARAAQALGRDEVAGDEFILMRAELRGSLPTGVRVLREAPTYLLCALEYGDAALAALQRRDTAAAAVAEAEERVRTGLTEIVGQQAAGLNAAAAALGEFDVLVCAARFTQHYDCTPATIAKKPILTFDRARFLPLEAELAAAGRRFVPLDVELHDTAVLTGPNMGGKSVCLQTCGFIALCAAFGLPVPAARAQSALFDQVAWLGTGREAQIGGLLSSFAREVLELRAILERAAPRLLILADEFARTTTPHEGRALMVALLMRLRELAACGMLATHLAGIAATAGVRHFAVRGLRGIPRQPPTQGVGEALASLADAMDYTIAEVSGDDVTRADAIALTALLGIDREFVNDAYRALSQ
jgi:DNA mismatch repair protein MutS2